ncbi:hypothetical protein TraAM80_04845 [Trypanosoma rangeli]|uniref:Cilia- and flagella-associated protein 91 n=1 Tax=Trypanosoma rangeli TaxID=5698 RepID=A0A422NI23_TRYRA|nr:uncharacterized protein TraAM80_04845 [Trypanosoma rangeli]RNF05116.1 hypothetical protein TraAM80_04845 [Trypanosoma rangeli]|eukprot:RNF05116.1 hypothetical protein TraAM80_04845 [Trypanosoma rangeli]
MYYRQQHRHPPSVMGAHGFTTEVAGRDRVRYFRRPVEARSIPTTYADIDNVRFATSVPPTPTPTMDLFEAASFSGRTASASGHKKARPHHLPAIKRNISAGKRAPKAPTTPMNETGASREVGIQTVYRENEAQTEPYTPEYYIPEGGDPNPEVLGIHELKWNNGLPAGVEEVELIQRLRRRRALEASLPPETDAKSSQVRHRALYDLEVQERKEREEHMTKMRQRRLDDIRDALMEREGAREEANRLRLEEAKTRKLADLKRFIERSEMKRIATTQKLLGDRASKTASSVACGMYAVDPVESNKPKKDLIEAYSRYGAFAATTQASYGRAVPPTPMRPSDHFRYYDVRPTILTLEEGIKELEEVKVPRIQRLPANTFVTPDNDAINSLPTLYQRREAARVVDALEYVNTKIHKSDSREETMRVIELYRATPRLQRPDTPELELEDDAEESVEEACILLQRLLRGRAVQNDFFDGKERCRGLIEELQAASNAKYAERSVEEKEAEEKVKRLEAVADSFGDAAQGDIIVETLDYLFNELERQRDLSTLEGLRREAEAVRAEREAKEAELRAQERILHDKEAVQYAAYIRAIDDVVECYSHQLYTTVGEECAMEEAIDAECNRLESVSLLSVEVPDADVTENQVCDMLDSFVLPAVVDMVRLRSEELKRKAPAAVAVEEANDTAPSKEGERPV